MLQIWHYFDYKAIPTWASSECFFYIDGHLWKLLKLRGDVICCDILHRSESGDVVRVSTVCRYILTILIGKISNKYNESSLIGGHIAVSLALKEFRWL